VIAAAILGWGIVGGVDHRRILVLLAAIITPLPLAVLIAFHVWRARPAVSTRTAVFCESVAGELRSGASLRLAVERAASSVGAPVLATLAHEGASLPEVALAARAEFQEIGVEVGVVIERLAKLGSPAASLFEELAGLSLAQVEVAHEVSAAMAPARATAAVLLMVPLVAIGAAASRGQIGGYLSTSAQRISAVIGLALVLVGVGVAGAILRRAR
jgi:hypothetical protein